MYDRVQKSSSSRNPSPTQKKKSSKYGPRTFTVQPRRETKSSQTPVPKNSLDATNKPLVTLVGTREVPAQRQGDALTLQPKSEQEAAPVEEAVTVQEQAQEVEIHRQCKECQEQEKDSDEMSSLGVGAKLTVRAPQDKYEQEADRVAAQVMSMSVATNNSPQFMEPRFGADFSSVRVHTGSEAVQMNRELGAQAFAHGSDVFFGAGKSPGNNELTHVVQQTGAVQRQVDSRHSTSSRKLSDSITETSDSSIQRSFITTGDRAGFLSLVNRIIGVQYEVRSDSAGNLSIVNTDVQGPPTLEASVLISLLQKVINDSKVTTIEFIRGRATTSPVIVGSYVLSQIDLDDIEAFGSGEGASSASTLVHEIEEQYRKQVHAETYGIAHASGINLENQVTGAVRGSEVPLTRAVQHPDGTVSVTMKIPYTYPDGRIVDVVLTIDHNNITNVTRTERPRPKR